ncbi:Protein argonaute-2, partial [Ophiophagus hannah]
MSLVVPESNPLLKKEEACRKRNEALLGGVIGVVQLIVHGFSWLRMMAAGDLGGGLAVVVPAVEIGELLAVIFLIFFRVVMVGSDDVLGRLGLRNSKGFLFIPHLYWFDKELKMANVFLLIFSRLENGRIWAEERSGGFHAGGNQLQIALQKRESSFNDLSLCLKINSMDNPRQTEGLHKSAKRRKAEARSKEQATEPPLCEKAGTRVAATFTPATCALMVCLLHTSACIYLGCFGAGQRRHVWLRRKFRRMLKSKEREVRGEWPQPHGEAYLTTAWATQPPVCTEEPVQLERAWHVKKESHFGNSNFWEGGKGGGKEGGEKRRKAVRVERKEERKEGKEGGRRKREGGREGGRREKEGRKEGGREEGEKGRKEGGRRERKEGRRGEKKEDSKGGKEGRKKGRKKRREGGEKGRGGGEGGRRERKAGRRERRKEGRQGGREGAERGREGGRRWE